MDKHAIITSLQSTHREFTDCFSTMSDPEFVRAPENKWTPGQHLEHIRRSVAAVNMAIRLPRFILRLLFGKANRPSRDYDALVTKYKSRLMDGGRAGGRFIPPHVAADQNARIREKLEGEIKALRKKISGWNERDLDFYILPHPLLGKLTIREMMYFTAYHAIHHRDILRKPPYASTELPDS